MITDKFSERLENVKRFLQKQEYVSLAYLFGSYASRNTGPLSDIDIAICFDKKLGKNEKADKKLFLINEIAKILNTDKLDIVIMNDSDLLLNFNIIRTGVLIKSSSSGAEFEAKVMDEFLDREYYEQLSAEIGLNRISKNGLIK